MHSTANGAGWVKVHRALKYSGVYHDSEQLHIWLHLLLSANHEPATVRLDDGREIELAAGQMIVSRAGIARATGICESKIERTIIRFKNELMIEQISFSKYRVISICNWHEYQSGEQITEQKTNRKPNTVKKKEVRKKHIGVSDSIFEQVATALNEATGKQYRSNGGELVKGVSARLKEGFRLDDFIRVIQHKSAQWGADAKMTRYLRPETLFGSKFESYLNEAGGPVTEIGNASTWQDEQQRQVIDELLD